MPEKRISDTLPPLAVLLTEGAILDNTRLSTATDYLANEDTFVAWIKLSLSLSFTGIAMVKWKEISNESGYLVILLGVAILAGSTRRYMFSLQQLSRDQFAPNVHTALGTMVMVLVATISLVVLNETGNL